LISNEDISGRSLRGVGVWGNEEAIQ